MKKSLIIIFLIFSVKPCFSEVLLWVDNNPVGVGEMFNLYIELKNVDDFEEPNIDLIKGLQLINRSEQNQTSIVGNKINRTVKWTYVMLAQYTGNYQIPSLKIGNEYTKPILIHVVESQKTQQTEIVKLEVNVSPKKVYPQQQILIKLRIIRDGIQLVNESITPLEIQETKIEKIKEDTFQVLKNGKKQLITEILFVAIPEKSGELKIPQVSYQGDEINGVNLGSIFQKFGSYSQNKGRRIFSKSKPHSIEVLPIPNNVNGWWLPVYNLKLEEKWEQGQNKFIVGEPFTRTISISVEGAYADQIPKLEIKYPKGIKTYSDKPILKTKKTKNGLEGLRIEKLAIIPNNKGKIELPEISIDWWDVSKKQMRSSKIPAKIINVFPNDSIIKKESSQIESNYETEKHKKESLNHSKLSEINNKNIIWKVLTISFALLWIGTIILWFVKKNYKTNLKNKEENLSKDNEKKLTKATKRLKNAIETGTPSDLKYELLNWSKKYWENDPPKGLEQIGDRIPEIKNSINALNSILYSKKQSKNIKNELQREFRKIDFYLPKNDKKNRTYLSQINPEKND